jgi:hypothetical protein
MPQTVYVVSLESPAELVFMGLVEAFQWQITRKRVLK